MGPTGLRVRAGDGSARVYLNAEIPLNRRTGMPVGAEASAVCDRPGRCGHGYTHLMLSGGTICEECRLDDLAQRAAELQAAGIELGWGAAPLAGRARRMSHEDIAGFHGVRRRHQR